MIYAKKSFIYFELACAVIIVTFNLYFRSVSGRYADTLKAPMSKKERKQTQKEKESKRRAQEDVDKAARSPDYKSMRDYLEKTNKEDKRREAKREKRWKY
jgi:hypothetical protein